MDQVVNVIPLVELQSTLDTHILHTHKELQGKDNLDWKVLALLTELGECANEWRGFKKWSKNQVPVTSSIVVCHACSGKRYFKIPYQKESEDCGYCEGTGFQEDRNPLLEEFVDVVHFTLSVGIEIKFRFETFDYNHLYNEMDKHTETITELFIFCHWLASNLLDSQSHYEILLESVITLGFRLGFSWSEIERAYDQKNKENHQRQLSNY